MHECSEEVASLCCLLMGLSQLGYSSERTGRIAKMRHHIFQWFHPMLIDTESESYDGLQASRPGKLPL